MDLLSPPQDVSCLVIEQRIFLIPVLKQSKKFSRVKELKEEFLIWVSYFPNSQESKSNTFCFFKKLSKSRTECDMEELVILNLSTEAHKNNMARTSTASELFQMVCQKPFDNICKSIYCVNKYIDWIFKMCLRQEESRLGKTFPQCFISQQSSIWPWLFPVLVEMTEMMSTSIPSGNISQIYSYNVRRIFLAVRQGHPLHMSSSTPLLMHITLVDLRKFCPFWGDQWRRNSSVERSQTISLDHLPSTKHPNCNCVVCFYIGHAGQIF